ncbi:aldo/keto reductase [Propioniciclava coleopterorum]|uniref:Aldo/keto reductase n=1 Tax=Propioniciclava coleopterorum TaxID=2714937 RepID=A0A6G7Y4F6_9ACTN|nr:aldo/keto reductase [Propioniciclava coleopterorum]
MPPRVPTVPLPGGGGIPQLGFGTYKVAPEQAEGVVAEALAAGYRHIDTAAMYGNEREVGRALAASGIPRADLFVTSKLDNPYHAVAEVGPAFERSLDDLGLERLDLYLIHWPLARSTDYRATWAAVVDLLATGRVAAVGVSNFTAEHLRAVIDATGVVPAVNQVEINPYLSQEPLRALHRKWGIVTQAWSPLARGRVLTDPQVLAVAHRLGATPAQVVLAWHLDRGDVTFPKASSPARMAENLGALDVAWDADARAVLDGLNRDERSGSDPDVVELDGGRR